MKFLILIITIFGFGFSMQKCPEITNQYKLLVVDSSNIFIEYMQTNNEIKKDTGTILFESNNSYILHKRNKDKTLIQKENVYYLKYYR